MPTLRAATRTWDAVGQRRPASRQRRRCCGTRAAAQGGLAGHPGVRAGAPPPPDRSRTASDSLPAGRAERIRYRVRPLQAQGLAGQIRKAGRQERKWAVLPGFLGSWFPAGPKRRWKAGADALSGRPSHSTVESAGIRVIFAPFAIPCAPNQPWLISSAYMAGEAILLVMVSRTASCLRCGQSPRCGSRTRHRQRDAGVLHPEPADRLVLRTRTASRVSGPGVAVHQALRRFAPVAATSDLAPRARQRRGSSVGSSLLATPGPGAHRRSGYSAVLPPGAARGARGLAGQHPRPPRGAVEKALLHAGWARGCSSIVSGILADRVGDGVEPHRPARELHRDRVQDLAVHPVEPLLVDVEPLEAARARARQSSRPSPAPGRSPGPAAAAGSRSRRAPGPVRELPASVRGQRQVRAVGLPLPVFARARPRCKVERAVDAEPARSRSARVGVESTTRAASRSRSVSVTTPFPRSWKTWGG